MEFVALDRWNDLASEPYPDRPTHVSNKILPGHLCPNPEYQQVRTAVLLLLHPLELAAGEPPRRNSAARGGALFELPDEGPICNIKT